MDILWYQMLNYSNLALTSFFIPNEKNKENIQNSQMFSQLQKRTLPPVIAKNLKGSLPSLSLFFYYQYQTKSLNINRTII